MTDITIRCPNCAMTMRIQAEWEGMTMKCPGCMQNITIPSGKQVSLPENTVPTPPPANQSPFPGLPANISGLANKFSGFMSKLRLAGCLLLVLIGLATLIRGSYLAVRVSLAKSERIDITQKEKILREYRYSSNYSRPEYEKRRKDLDERTERWEKNYEDIQNLTHKPVKSLVVTGIVIFLGSILAAWIDHYVFSLSYGNLTKTACPVSQKGIIRLQQILEGTFALLLIILAFDTTLLLLIPGLWFAAIAISMSFPEKLGIILDPEASLAEDCTAWMILPLKAALSNIFLPFMAGEIVLVINFFKHDYLSFTGDTIIMALIALLPLIHYLVFLFSAYFLEIGLSIVAVPKLLKEKK